MINRIPPMNSEETIQYYRNGQIPERFRDSDEARHKAILSEYAHDEPRKNDVYDYLKAGGYIPDEEQNN